MMLIVGKADDSGNSSTSSEGGGGWDIGGNDVPTMEKDSEDPLTILNMLIVGEADGEGSPSSIPSDLVGEFETSNALEAKATIDSAGEGCEEPLPSTADEINSGRSSSSDASAEANVDNRRSPRGEILITALCTMLTSKCVLVSF